MRYMVVLILALSVAQVIGRQLSEDVVLPQVVESMDNNVKNGRYLLDGANSDENLNDCNGVDCGALNDDPSSTFRQLLGFSWRHKKKHHGFKRHGFKHKKKHFKSFKHKKHHKFFKHKKHYKHF